MLLFLAYAGNVSIATDIECAAAFALAMAMDVTEGMNLPPASSIPIASLPSLAELGPSASIESIAFVYVRQVQIAFVENANKAVSHASLCSIASTN